MDGNDFEPRDLFQFFNICKERIFSNIVRNVTWKKGAFELLPYARFIHSREVQKVALRFEYFKARCNPINRIIFGGQAMSAPSSNVTKRGQLCRFRWSR
jgi:hypothetical protein